MAEGTRTYEGLAIPLYGEYEQTQQTLATDMVTLTGAASMTGDFLVCQTSDGTENFVVSSSGLVSTTAGLALSSSITATQQQLTVSATTMVAGLNVVVTSTGALQALGTTEESVTGITVSPSSDAIMNAAFAYAGGSTATGNTAISMLACMGANSLPSYFLAIGASAGDAIYKGATLADNAGFIDTALKVNTFDGSDWIGIKCLNGSQTLYLVAIHSSGTDA